MPIEWKSRVHELDISAPSFFQTASRRTSNNDKMNPPHHHHRELEEFCSLRYLHIHELDLDAIDTGLWGLYPTALELGIREWKLSTLPTSSLVLQQQIQLWQQQQQQHHQRQSHPPPPPLHLRGLSLKFINTSNDMVLKYFQHTFQHLQDFRFNGTSRDLKLETLLGQCKELRTLQLGLLESLHEFEQGINMIGASIWSLISERFHSLHTLRLPDKLCLTHILPSTLTDLCFQLDPTPTMLVSMSAAIGACIHLRRIDLIIPRQTRMELEGARQVSQLFDKIGTFERLEYVRHRTIDDKRHNWNERHLTSIAHRLHNLIYHNRSQLRVTSLSVYHEIHHDTDIFIPVDLTLERGTLTTSYDLSLAACSNRVRPVLEPDLSDDTRDIPSYFFQNISLSSMRYLHMTTSSLEALEIVTDAWHLTHLHELNLTIDLTSSRVGPTTIQRFGTGHKHKTVPPPVASLSSTFRAASRQAHLHTLAIRVPCNATDSETGTGVASTGATAVSPPLLLDDLSSLSHCDKLTHLTLELLNGSWNCDEFESMLHKLSHLKHLSLAAPQKKLKKILTMMIGRRRTPTTPTPSMSPSSCASTLCLARLDCFDDHRSSVVAIMRNQDVTIGSKHAIRRKQAIGEIATLLKQYGTLGASTSFRPYSYACEEETPFRGTFHGYRAEDILTMNRLQETKRTLRCNIQ